MESSKLKIVTTIKDNEIYSLCLLKDGRLVSGGDRGIVIYSRNTLQTDLIIQCGYGVESILELRNGSLVSSSANGYMSVYERDGNGYKLKIKKYINWINKVIELGDGKLCSCYSDGKITIWDDNSYEPIKNFQGHTEGINLVIEMNGYIISVGEKKDNSVKVWDKHTYKSIRTIKGVYCFSSNGVSKLRKNTIILGGYGGEIFILDVLSFQYKTFTDRQLGSIWSVCVLGEDKVLLGNNTGKIVCYDSSINQLVFSRRVHEYDVLFIIKCENNKIVSSSSDSINIYEG